MVSPKARPVTHRRSIVTNFLFLALGQALYKVTALVGLSLLARYLGSADFGRFTVALAAVQLFEMLTDAGIGHALVQRGAGRPERLAADLSVALPARLVLAALNVGLALMVITATVTDPQVRELTLWLGVAQGLSALTTLLRVVFQSFELMEYVALSVMMEGVLRLAAIVGGLVGVMGLVGIAKALVLAELVVFIATALVVAHQFIRPVLGGAPLRRCVEVVGLGIPFALAWQLLSADQRIDTLLLGRLLGDTSVAVFGAAARVMEVTLIVPTMLAAAFFPAAVRHERENLSALSELLAASLKAIVAIGMPIALALAILAGPFVSLIFGNEFTEAVIPLRILAPAALLLFGRIGLIQIALALGRLRVAIVAQLVALAVDVALALALIPLLGAQGAAWAQVGAEVTAVAWAALALREFFGRGAVANLGRPLIAGAVAAGVGTAVAGLSIGLAAIAAAAAYLVVLWLVPIFTSREYAYVRSTVPFLGTLMSFAVRREA